VYKRQNLDGKSCSNFDDYTGGFLTCASDCEYDLTQCTALVEPTCGDDIINQITEDCDLTDLDGKTCQTFGYEGGILGCDANCGFDTSFCTNPLPKYCGNGVIESPNDGNIFEECDSFNLGGKSCSNFDDYNDLGTLKCTSDCELDFSECIREPIPICGDDLINQMLEDCDGTDLRGLDCSYFGYTSGTVSCNADCTFNTNLCSGMIDPGKSCGDGTINRVEEECDINDVGGMICNDFDDYTGGTLGCTSTCQYDFEGCTGTMPACNDGVVNTIDEICDGEDLMGVTCEDLGYASGTLACNSYCDGYIVNSCYSAPYCGDAIKNRVEEECDGLDLGGQVCDCLLYTSPSPRD